MIKKLIISIAFAWMVSCAAEQAAAGGVELQLRHETGLEFRAEMHNCTDEEIAIVLPMNRETAAAGVMSMVLQEASGARTRVTYCRPKEAEDGGYQRKRPLPERQTIKPGEKAEFTIDLMDGNWRWPALLPMGEEVEAYVEYDYPASAYAWSGHAESPRIRLPIARILEWYVLDVNNKQHFFHYVARSMSADYAEVISEEARSESARRRRKILQDVAAWDAEQVRRRYVQHYARHVLKLGYGNIVRLEKVEAVEVGYEADGAPEALPFEQAVRYAMCRIAAAEGDARQQAELDKLFSMKGVERWTPERALHVAQEVLLWHGALRAADDERVAAFLRRLPDMSAARSIYGRRSGDAARAWLLEQALACDSPGIAAALLAKGICPEGPDHLRDIESRLAAPYSEAELRERYAAMQACDSYGPDVHALNSVWPRLHRREIQDIFTSLGCMYEKRACYLPAQPYNRGRSQNGSKRAL